MRPAMLLLAPLLLLLPQEAGAAEAVTYSGTLGRLPIIVELVLPEGGEPPYGRYSYLAKGGDIPLHGAATTGGRFALGEEKPCTEKLCSAPDGAETPAAPIGADWMLEGRAGDRLIEGNWKSRENGRRFPLRLKLEGRRTIVEQPESPIEALNPLYSNTGRRGDLAMVDAESLPYDFLKMAWPLEKGREVAFGAGAYRLDTDPRVGMDYPTVTRLDGADSAALNRFLAQQRLQAELAAFSCMSMVYMGFGWRGDYFETSDGFDGNWSVTVEHLSGRLMGYMESGSYFCGGAHPHNFGDHRLVDVRAGRPIEAKSLLKGWTAVPAEATEGDAAQGTRYEPTADLIDHVRTNRRKFDADTEESCGYDDLLADYLGVYISGDSLAFTLEGLPHVIFACTDDMLVVPLEDARPLLRDKALAYFPQIE